MDAITALHSRNSVPLLTEPPPQADSREAIFKAALRAPDHGWLRPFRFLTIEGQNRETLGQLFVEATQQDEPDIDEQKCKKLAAKPLRAPLIIVVIVSINDHPKIPKQEQLLSAGAAAQNMLIAAHAQGFGAIWRTGAMAYHEVVRQGLGIAENEHIIGYLYIGTVAAGYKPLPEMAVEEFFAEWS